MSDALHILLDVQEHDTAIDQLHHRRANLPERGDLASLEQRMASLDERLATVGARRDKVAGRQSALEADVNAAENRIAEVDKRLYSGTVSASRDLQAMSEEIEHLKARRSMLEDRILEVMEEREPLDAEVAALEAERVAAEEEAASVRVALGAAEAAVDQELAGVEAERAAVAGGVPADLLATYERLRAKLGGVGAAKLMGSQCSGCHLALPATELDRLRRGSPDDLVFCDQCGRILVRV
ncbi:MAG TPA: C4-type zinc ribbon domain-containing protein [Acidimicrobiales bacterium]|nr:C4-type zinc ribbon domain-containing protein [Acidimicrobiales bacterium]